MFPNVAWTRCFGFTIFFLRHFCRLSCGVCSDSWLLPGPESCDLDLLESEKDASSLLAVEPKWYTSDSSSSRNLTRELCSEEGSDCPWSSEDELVEITRSDSRKHSSRTSDPRQYFEWGFSLSIRGRWKIGICRAKRESFSANHCSVPANQITWSVPKFSGRIARLVAWAGPRASQCQWVVLSQGQHDNNLIIVHCAQFY